MRFGLTSLRSEADRKVPLQPYLLLRAAAQQPETSQRPRGKHVVTNIRPEPPPHQWAGTSFPMGHISTSRLDPHPGQSPLWARPPIPNK